MVHIINNLYLIRFDDRNLAIIKGKPTIRSNGSKRLNVIGYYGTIQSALQKSITLSIVEGAENGELTNMLTTIQKLDERINILYQDLSALVNLQKGEKS